MARRADRARARRRARQSDDVRQLADEVARRLTARVPGAEPPARARTDADDRVADEPRLDLSGIEPEPPESNPAHSRRRTRA